MVASERATTEVWGAVVASTLTTLAVFLPVLFIEEEAGQLFRDIALAIGASVGLSLVVSVTVIPVAAARLLRTRDSVPAPRLAHRGAPRTLPGEAKLGGLSWLFEQGGRLFVAHVVAVNSWVLHGWLRRLAVVATLTAVSVGLTYLLWPKVEYLPVGNRNLVACIVLPPPGYNLSQLMQLGETVEDALRPYWDIDPDSEEAARLDFPAIRDFFYVARGRSVFLGLRSADPRTSTS